MKFIKDDEFILLMEDQYGARFTQDDLKRFRDVGIQTIVRYPYWGTIEPSMGNYDWSEIENFVDLSRNAGLKSLWAVYDKPPKYFPPEWYMKTPEDKVYVGKFRERILSPWNAEGWAYHLKFIKMFCDKLSADDMLCFRATVHGAESMFPHDPRFPHRQDGPYIETMLKMLLEEQDIFYNAHDSHELWTCFHHSFDYQGTAGTEHAEMLYKAMRDKFPDHKHYCISYTQFMKGIHGVRENLADVQRLGLSMFAGSQYAEGLVWNTDKAIQQGFRGFICGPIMAWAKHRKTEDWMFDNVRDSMAKWRKARNV